MRNPIRLKNVRTRFIPFYLAVGLLLWLVRPHPAAYAIGFVVVSSGAALRSWGAGHLVKTEHLTISGPYARLRHPLYLGTLLCGLGFGLIVGGPAAAAACALFLPWFFASYFPRKEATEARRLEERYGRAFAAYRAAVPALLPRLQAFDPAPETRAVGDIDSRWQLDRYSENNELGTLIAIALGLVLFGLRAWVSI